MMMMITLRNIHTNEVITVKLVEKKTTWQNIFIVKLNGTIQTLTNSQGWTDKV